MATTKPPRAQLEALRQERDDLRAALQRREDELTRHVSVAAGDPVAMFILTQIVEARVLTVEEIAENLVAPGGWLAFAKLWQAWLIDCPGHDVLPTDAGIELVRELERWRLAQ